ncbi:hypothetical protein ACTXLS_08285 [Corynebacterium variabile]|uniref:hypothetical protein n=1 Tax=Corynebacterium variabile TaxID=1727 RepID=UPI003FD0DA9E
MGDYVKNRSWSGMLRVFEHAEASPVTEEGGSQFRNTMNHCEEVMYLVTFRSVNENVVLDAQLLDAAKSVGAHAELHDGWMLGTNCELPQFVFVSSTDTSNLGDVAYGVTEYRQSSVAVPVAEPYVVECLKGVAGPAQWSDGTTGYAEECADTPEARRSIRAEGLCGGLYTPEDVSREEFEAICNRAPTYSPEDAS